MVMAVAFPSSGNLIGSVLETLGGHYQSFILDQLSFVLLQPAAVLLYVVAIVGILVRFLLRGKVDDLSLWILVGPALLYLVLTTRSEYPGTIWQFGQEQRNQAHVWHEVRKYLGESTAGDLAGAQPERQAKVSSLFLYFNKLTSGVIRSITGVLSRANSNVDVRFLVNAEFSSTMRSETVSDTGLRQLIHGPFMRDCSQMMSLAKGLEDTSKARDTLIGLARRLQDAEMQLVNPKQSSTAAYDYLKRLHAKYPDGFRIAATSTPIEVTEWITTEQKRLREPVPVTSSAPEIQPIAETFTCRAIWNFVSLGLYEFAARAVLEKASAGEKMGIDPEEMLRDLSLVKPKRDRANLSVHNIQEEVSRLLHLTTKIASMYLLRNELSRMSGAAFINQYSKKGFEVPTMEGVGESDLAFLERIRTQFSEWKERSAVFAAASNLPFYQGVGLYLLSIVFPFFALLLVIPGRHTGFLMWFFLWIWLKSWEIGFTIVMLLSDVMYELFTFGREIDQVASVEGWQADLATNLSALRDLDPSFQLTTYYSIIGTCLMAVPVISSYLILGSLKGGASLIAGGVQELSNPIVEHAFMSQNAKRVLGERQIAAEEEMRQGLEYMSRWRSGGGAERGDFGTPTNGGDKAVKLDPTVRSGGNIQSLTGEELTSQANSVAASLGQAAGTAGSSPYAQRLGKELPGPLHGSTGQQMLGDFTNPISGIITTQARADQVRESQRISAYLEMREIDLARETASAPFDTFNLLDIQRRSAITRVAGAFEAPWTTRDGDWEQILDTRFAAYRLRVTNEVASIQARLAAFPGYDMFARTLTLKDALAWKTFLTINKGNLHHSPDFINTVFTPPNPGGETLGDNDFDVKLGTNRSGSVSSVNDGLVMFKGVLEGRGNTVILRHRNGSYTISSGLDLLADDYNEGDVIFHGHELGRSQKGFHFSIAARGEKEGFDLLQAMPILSSEFAPTKRKKLPDDLAKIFADFERKVVERNFESIPPPR
jgi:hypothetical protein